jgi:hypothetical protein
MPLDERLIFACILEDGILEWCKRRSSGGKIPSFSSNYILQTISSWTVSIPVYSSNVANNMNRDLNKISEKYTRTWPTLYTVGVPKETFNYLTSQWIEARLLQGALLVAKQTTWDETDYPGILYPWFISFVHLVYLYLVCQVRDYPYYA